MSDQFIEVPRFVRDGCPHAFESGRLGRVLRAETGRLLLRTVHGEHDAELGSWQGAEQPVAGDWVELDQQGLVCRLVPRRNALARRAVGRRAQPQVIAANIELVMIVMALDGDFSVRRIERYLTLAYQAQAAPVVLLTKAGTCPDVASYVAELRAVARDVPVHAIDVLSGINPEAPAGCLLPGATAVLVGSSGVGKSTLLNHLLQAPEVATQPVRARDSKGRHTTTWRELRYLPNGAAIIDTPGMREVQLWAGTEALLSAFDDVATLAADCRYRDCRHHGEPGCALALAVAHGELDPARLASFDRLRSELAERPIAQKRGDERMQARALRARLKQKRGDD